MRTLQIVIYEVVEKGTVNKGILWYSHDASIRAAAVDEKAHLGMRQC